MLDRLSTIRGDRDFLVGIVFCGFALLSLLQSYMGVTRPAEMIERYGIAEFATEAEMVITSSGGILLSISTIAITVHWNRQKESFDGAYYFLITACSVLGVFGAVVLPFIPIAVISSILFVLSCSWGDFVNAFYQIKSWFREMEDTLYGKFGL